jgi:hypothetical protein
VEAGHSWKVDPAVAGTIPDTATGGAQTLTEGTGVGRGTAQPNPDVFDTDPDTLEQVVRTVDVSTFTGTGAATGSGTTPALAMSNSFTVAVWAMPTTTNAANPSATVSYSVFAQEGTAISGFFLDAYRNQWRFCMPTTQVAAPFDGVCVTSGTTGVAVNQWTYLVGQWDAVNHQVRLTVGTPGTPWIKSHASTAAANGVIDVGRRNTAYPWVGSIYDPQAMQAIATVGQLSALRLYSDPKDL